MEKGISTEVVKLDLSTILANYKKPEFWKKTWTIIDTKWLTIVWYISSIDCVNSKICSVLKVSKLNYKKGNKVIKDIYWNNEAYCSVIPIDNKEYTQEHFENNIFGTLLRLINNIEQFIITRYKEYENARDADSRYKKSLKQIAEDFLDEYHITNRKVREAYIESFVNKTMEDYKSLAGKVLDNYKYKLILEVYVYASIWFDRKSEYELFSSKDKNRKSLFEEIKEQIKLIQTDDWKDSMKNKLEVLS